jgi:hypothetical protein
MYTHNVDQNIMIARRRIVAILVFVVATALLLLAAHLLGGHVALLNNVKPFGKFAFIALACLLLWAVRLFLGLWQLTAKEILSTNPEPPILLLRSFSDDRMSALPLERGVSGVLVNEWNATFSSFEQVVAKSLESFGPVIAIGRPGEMAHPPGAGRLYIGHSDWKENVESLLKTCRVVVMIVGEITENNGLSWEANQLFNGHWRDKVLFLFPPVPNVKDVDSVLRTRWEAYRKLQRGRVGKYVNGALLACFRPPNTCQCSNVSPSRSVNAYRLALEHEMRKRCAVRS